MSSNDVLVAQNLRASHKILTHLEKSKANTENMVDRLPDCYFVINRKGRILKGNEIAAKIMGANQDTIINNSIARLFSKESWNIFNNKIDRLVEVNKEKIAKKEVKKYENITFELHVDGKTESQLSFHWNMRIFEGVSDRRGVLISVFGRDITQIKEYERQLAEIFSAIPLGITMINANGFIDGPYSSYLDYLFEMEDLKDANLFDLLFEPAKKKMNRNELKGLEELRKVFGVEKLFYEVAKKWFPKEIFYEGKSGKIRWMRVTYHPVVREDLVEKILLVFDDITRVRAEMDKKQGTATNPGNNQSIQIKRR